MLVITVNISTNHSSVLKHEIVRILIVIGRFVYTHTVLRLTKIFLHVKVFVQFSNILDNNIYVILSIN